MPSPASPKDFVERCTARGLRALVFDWSAILVLAAIGIACDHWVVSLALAWPIGLFQFAIGEALAHEACHYNLFRQRSWNDRAECFLTIPFFFRMANYRPEHLNHHSKFNTEQDHLVADYRNWGLFRIPPKLIWIWFVKPTIGIAGLSYFATTVVPELLSFRTGWKLWLFWVPVVSTFWMIGHFDWLLWYWLLPLTWCFTSFLWRSEIEDHFNTDSSTRSNVGWINFFTHNNGFHYAHHEYPSIPFYRLPAAHEALCREVNTHISSGFWQTFSQLRRSS